MTDSQPIPGADLSDDGGKLTTSPREAFVRSIARRCHPWPEKAALVFVERWLNKTRGHTLEHYWFPSEGVLLMWPNLPLYRGGHSDFSYPIRPAPEDVNYYRDRRSPANRRFLERVAYRKRRGPARKWGPRATWWECELYRPPEVTALWDGIRERAVWCSALPYDLCFPTSEQVEKLAGLCEHREFVFGEPAEPRRRRKAKARPGAGEPAPALPESSGVLACQSDPAPTPASHTHA